MFPSFHIADKWPDVRACTQAHPRSNLLVLGFTPHSFRGACLVGGGVMWQSGKATRHSDLVSVVVFIWSSDLFSGNFNHKLHIHYWQSLSSCVTFSLERMYLFCSCCLILNSYDHIWCLSNAVWGIHHIKKNYFHSTVRFEIIKRPW